MRLWVIRDFFELGDITKKAPDGVKSKPISPIALKAVRRLDACSRSSVPSPSASLLNRPGRAGPGPCCS